MSLDPSNLESGMISYELDEKLPENPTQEQLRQEIETLRKKGISDMEIARIFMAALSGRAKRNKKIIDKSTEVLEEEGIFPEEDPS